MAQLGCLAVYDRYTAKPNFICIFFRFDNFFLLQGYITHEVYFWIDIHRVIPIGYSVFACIPCFTWNAEVSGRNQVYSKSRSSLE